MPSIIAAFSDKGSVGAVAYLERLDLGLCIIADALVDEIRVVSQSHAGLSWRHLACTKVANVSETCDLQEKRLACSGTGFPSRKVSTLQGLAAFLQKHICGVEKPAVKSSTGEAAGISTTLRFGRYDRFFETQSDMWDMP